MYIFKNALKCISRSKGRNFLIGVIVLVISISACLGLSIRQAAETAKSDTMETLNVTATISFDRASLMQDMMSERADESAEPQREFDRSQFASKMEEFSSLTLDEYLTYANASSVSDFYYSITTSLNGNDDLEPVSSQDESEAESETSANTTENPFGDMPQMQGGDRKSFGGFDPQRMGAQNDFSVVGYSGESAMTDFINGTSTITDGSIFDEGSEELNCIISEELAAFNQLSVGQEITLCNASNDEETYTLTVVGIYTNSNANEDSFSIMGSKSTDPANQIYMSYSALQKIIALSQGSNTTVTDSDTGREYETALIGSLNATYVFADANDYYLFEEQVRKLGLDETYTVSSNDISQFENSLVPLNTLSTMAGCFLIVVLLIGAVILVVLNIFNVRERKYEIGVLTAMGMKKSKVAMQFLTEIFTITIVAVVIGLCVGATCSVPVTNALLENQITSQQTNQEKIEENFGRNPMPAAPDKNQMQAPDGEMPRENFGQMFNMDEAIDYVNEINSAMNLLVVFQMLGIAIVLTLISGAASMLFIMRYEPLKILANRD